MGRLEDGARTFGEPQVALHPGELGTFAFAVSDGRRPDAMAQDLPSAEPRGLSVYITRDDGASFTRHPIDLQAIGALPYNPAVMGADPAIVFTPDGALHVAGLIIVRPAPSAASPTGLETKLFALRSVDLGATWEPAVVVDDAGLNDREWLAASPQGEVLLSWRDHGPGSSRFVHAFGGIGPEASSGELADCRYASNAAWVDGVALLACSVGNDLQVWDVSSSPSALRGTAVGACPSNSPRLASTANGVLVAACYYGTYAVSLDGGRTWGTVGNVFEKASLDDDWGTGIGPNVFALGLDPRGMAHFVLSRFPATQDALPQGDGRPVLHLVLDPTTGQVVHERELQGESDGAGPAGYGWADDFYGVDFVGGRGLLAWSSPDWAIHFALVQVPA